MTTVADLYGMVSEIRETCRVNIHGDDRGKVFLSVTPSNKKD